jgi:ATP-dependent Lon protease
MELHDVQEIGVATGLAWTEVGGEILPIETTLMPGKGVLLLTGKLGEVMQESGKAALSYIRAHCAEFGIDPDFYTKLDIHVHVPEGGIPKDGPSAGVTMAISMLSALTKRPVRRDIAMTGEITLRGRVLKIGGLKEKVVAAHRHHVEAIIIPRDNTPELEEIGKEIRDAIRFLPVKSIDEAIKIAFAENVEAPPKSRKAPETIPPVKGRSRGQGRSRRPPATQMQ